MPAHERLEGSATYVGYEAARLVTGADSGVTDRVLLDNLAAPWSGVRIGEDDPWLLYSRWHAYVVGASKARLLDRLGIAWRAELENGITLDALLGA